MTEILTNICYVCKKIVTLTKDDFVNSSFTCPSCYTINEINYKECTQAEDISDIITPIKKEKINIFFKLLLIVVVILCVIWAIYIWNYLPISLAIFIIAYLRFLIGKDPGKGTGEFFDKNYSPKDYMKTQEEKDAYDKAEEEMKKKWYWRMMNTDIMSWGKKNK